MADLIWVEVERVIKLSGFVAVEDKDSWIHDELYSQLDGLEKVDESLNVLAEEHDSHFDGLEKVDESLDVLAEENPEPRKMSTEDIVPSLTFEKSMNYLTIDGHDVMHFSDPGEDGLSEFTVWSTTHPEAHVLWKGQVQIREREDDSDD